jgi:hypothetical protein
MMDKKSGESDKKPTYGMLLKLFLFVFFAPILLITLFGVYEGLSSLNNYVGYDDTDYSYLLYNSFMSSLSGVLPNVVLISFISFALFSFGIIFSKNLWEGDLMPQSKKGLAVFFLVPVIFQSLLIAGLFTDMVYGRMCRYMPEGAARELMLPLVTVLASFILFLVVLFHILTSKPINKEMRSSMSRLSIIISLAFIFSFIWALLVTSAGMCDPVVTGFVKFQPLSINYATNGSYQARLRNVLGLPVEVRAISAKETINDMNCSMDVLGSGGGNKVGPGGLLTLKGVCPEKSEGESFDLILMFNYTAHGQNITHIDLGHLKGQAGY